MVMTMQCTMHNARCTMKNAWLWSCVLGVVVLGTGVTLHAQHGTKAGDWPNHGGDKGFTRYSPLDQINKENVKTLRIVWRRPAVDEAFRAKYPTLKYSNQLRGTPIMVAGVLYASNGIGLVEAFDPATGKTLWVQELPEPGEAALGVAGAQQLRAHHRREGEGDDAGDDDRTRQGEGELAEEDAATIAAVVSRLGVADMRAFDLT